MRTTVFISLFVMLPSVRGSLSYLDEHKRRQGDLYGSGGLLGGILGSTVTQNTGDLLEGVLGGIAQLVDLDDKRPDAAHPFQEPGPTDQRGPCPGLNTLANHGYLPRNGIVTVGQTIEATAEGFNMSPELSALLAVAVTAFSGNIETETFSIGGEDNRTYSPVGIGGRAAGPQYGLDDHSHCEGDASATRADYFTNAGDNHSGQPDRFRRFVELAKQHGGSFGYEAANALYAENARLSVANNPRLYFQGLTAVVVLAQYPFFAAFMSNGTYNAGGTANYESLAPIMGFRYNAGNDTFEYVPERFPENWYRRSIPYGLVTPDGLLTNLAPTLAKGIINLPNPLGALLTNHAQLGEIGCAVYQLVSSVAPASLALASVERVSAATTYLQEKLAPGLPKLFGCPVGDLSLLNSTGNADGSALQATGPGGEQKYYVSEQR